jgi:DNA topoisomerase IB
MNQFTFKKNIFKSGGKISPESVQYKKFEETPYKFNIDGIDILFFGNPAGSMDLKFNRITRIAERYDKITNHLKKLIYQNSLEFPANKEYCLAVASLLIIETGIRIGNEDSAEGFISEYKEKGKKVLAKTYGLTTLLQEHVEDDNGIIKFDFTGKKHVENKFTLSKEMSEYVRHIRRSNYTPFFNTNDGELTTFIKNETSPYLSSKDFRTFRANVFGYLEAVKLPKPVTKKERRERIREVCEKVSVKLNNTHAVVKTSYLDPDLFDYFFPEIL